MWGKEKGKDKNIYDSHSALFYATVNQAPA